LLEGKTVNLRVKEKEDLELSVGWLNNPDFFGEYEPLVQMSKTDLQKLYDNKSQDEGWFFIEKKDGGKVGNINHRPVGTAQEIGYTLLPRERGKGYCSEAVMIMVDYLFLSKNIIRIQAHADQKNVASQKALEKNGFKKEGTIRKEEFIRGAWRDKYLYSILREEWKKPKILTKTA
jgi:ribosomal-protein-alanine N-acetyltransferase